MAKFDVDPFGGWVLKCNPESTWDLSAFLADGNTHLEGWSVRQNKRSKAMDAGQPVAFWVSGNLPDCPPGLWSVGRVTGRPTMGKPDEYWIESGADLYVPIDLDLSTVEVPRSVVQADSVMAGSELIRMRQMSNPVMLTDLEWAALERLRAPESGFPA